MRFPGWQGRDDRQAQASSDDLDAAERGRVRRRGLPGLPGLPGTRGKIAGGGAGGKGGDGGDGGEGELEARVDPRVSMFLRVQKVGNLVLAGTLVAVIWVIADNRGNIDKINRERVERIDQSCEISERNQRADVESLKKTYEFLLKLKPPELRESLAKAILTNLPATEREAREDDAPQYCDEPNVGEEEPDRKVPPRPRSLSRR